MTSAHDTILRRCGITPLVLCLIRAALLGCRLAVRSVLVLAVISTTMSGCSRDRNLDEPVSSQIEREPAPASSVPQENPNAGKEFQLTVRELLDALEADSEGARSDYEGATVELSGRMRMWEIQGRHLFLFMSPVPGELGNLIEFILCEPTNPKPWEELTEDSAATLRGVVRYNSLGYMRLADCEVVSCEGGSMQQFTVEQLITDAARDLEAAYEQHHRQHYIVSGIVCRTDSEATFEGIRSPILLRGDGESVFPIHFMWIRQFDAVKVGDRLTVIGKCTVKIREEEGPAIGMKWAQNLTPFIME